MEACASGVNVMEACASGVNVMEACASGVNVMEACASGTLEEHLLHGTILYPILTPIQVG